MNPFVNIVQEKNMFVPFSSQCDVIFELFDGVKCRVYWGKYIICLIYIYGRARNIGCPSVYMFNI